LIEFIIDPGINWMGIPDLKVLMRRCKEAGATGFKPQLWRGGDLYSPEDNPFYDWQKSHELTYEQAKEIFDYGEEIKLKVFFSVYDTERVGWCEEIGVKRYKLAARSVENMELLRYIAETKKPVIMSMSVEHFSEKPYSFYHEMFEDLKILYTRSLYPTPVKALNFNRMVVDDGFSDHTSGIEMALIAAGQAVVKFKKFFIIEKHVYYGTDVIGKSPDMCVSISTTELTDLVGHVRKMEEY